MAVKSSFCSLMQKLLHYDKTHCQRCNRGVLASTLAFGMEGRVFEPCTGKPATTHSESCASYNCPMIVLREQPAGSHAPMVLNYSRCVVLGSGPA